ncbi:MAG: hypothetical protein AAFQ58_14765 [Pseudomonadota bacterium]
MTRSALACAMFFALAACNNPLSGIARMSEESALPQAPVTAALPSEEEVAREGSVLTELLTDQPDVSNPSVLPVEVMDDLSSTTADRSGDPDDTSTVASLGEETSVVAAETPGGTGILGWLRRSAQNEDKLAPAPESVPASFPTDDAITPAVPTDQARAGDTLVEPQKRRGLFGRVRTVPRTGPDVADVAPGTLLPFGVIARNCEARPGQTAKVIDKAARKGRGYALYDTAPDSTVPRTFYVTGFSDNCPRQFTASLALFGDPAFHEQLRYGLPADEYPYSTTDKAYEKLKRQVCHVGRNTPCGDRIDRLSRNTTFISAYENFTDNARWADMLLHDGAVLATALKTP